MGLTRKRQRSPDLDDSMHDMLDVSCKRQMMSPGSVAQEQLHRGRYAAAAVQQRADVVSTHGHVLSETTSAANGASAARSGTASPVGDSSHDLPPTLAASLSPTAVSMIPTASKQSLVHLLAKKYEELRSIKSQLSQLQTAAQTEVVRARAEAESARNSAQQMSSELERVRAEGIVLRNGVNILQRKVEEMRPYSEERDNLLSLLQQAQQSAARERQQRLALEVALQGAEAALRSGSWSGSGHTGGGGGVF